MNYIKQLVYYYGNEFTQEELERARELHKYENKRVALVDDKVVASGETMQDVAEKAGYTNVTFYLLPSGKVRFAL